MQETGFLLSLSVLRVSTVCSSVIISSTTLYRKPSTGQWSLLCSHRSASHSKAHHSGVTVLATYFLGKSV